MISAACNRATFLNDGERVDVSADDLLSTAVPLTTGRLGGVFKLEVLPNRDSLQYAETYGITSAKSLFRGTLRCNEAGNHAPSRNHAQIHPLTQPLDRIDVCFHASLDVADSVAQVSVPSGWLVRRSTRMRGYL